jgi:hypothetical protein
MAAVAAGVNAPQLPHATLGASMCMLLAADPLMGATINWGNPDTGWA